MDRNYHIILKKAKDAEIAEHDAPVHIYSETGFVPVIDQHSKNMMESRESDPPGEIYKNLFKDAQYFKGTLSSLILIDKKLALIQEKLKKSMVDEVEGVTFKPKIDHEEVDVPKYVDPKKYLNWNDKDATYWELYKQGKLKNSYSSATIQPRFLQKDISTRSPSKEYLSIAPHVNISHPKPFDSRVVTSIKGIIDSLPAQDTSMSPSKSSAKPLSERSSPLAGEGTSEFGSFFKSLHQLKHTVDLYPESDEANETILLQDPSDGDNSCDHGDQEVAQTHIHKQADHTEGDVVKGEDAEIGGEDDIGGDKGSEDDLEISSDQPPIIFDIEALETDFVGFIKNTYK